MFTAGEIVVVMNQIFAEGPEAFISPGQLLALTEATIKTGVCADANEAATKGPFLSLGFELGRRLQAARELEVSTKG